LVLINTAAGVRNIDSIYFDVATDLHPSKLMMLSDIALPLVKTCLRLGMAVALM
jgi:ABC-type nitrate/sulfonate/bicarbonate transport system permease component